MQQSSAPVPDGWSAALVLAAAGFPTAVFENNSHPGWVVPAPGWHCQDLLKNRDLRRIRGKASPCFRSLPIDIPWIDSPASCAHPLHDGTAAVVERSINAFANG
jgi:hypothetical protein